MGLDLILSYIVFDIDMAPIEEDSSFDADIETIDDYFLAPLTETFSDSSYFSLELDAEDFKVEYVTSIDIEEDYSIMEFDDEDYDVDLEEDYIHLSHVLELESNDPDEQVYVFWQKYIWQLPDEVIYMKGSWFN